MATNLAESSAVRKVSWGRNVEENPTRSDRPAATVTTRETTRLVPRNQWSLTDLRENISAYHLSFYQGNFHTLLTEVSLKSRGPCSPTPLVRGRSRSLRSAVLVLLCRSSEVAVDRCGLQNEYSRHLPILFLTLSYCIGNVCEEKTILRQYIVSRFLYKFRISSFYQ